jgi:hypothetical protein
MRKFFLLSFLLGFIILDFSVIAQGGKKPILMVVPGDNLCTRYGYVNTYDNQGVSTTTFDYKRALNESVSVLAVNDKISELFNIEWGFPLKNLSAVLKGIEDDRAREMLRESRSGASIQRNPMDVLEDVAKADIWIQVDYSINVHGPMRNIDFTMRAIDQYSKKQIATTTGSGPKLAGASVAELAQTAVVNYMQEFQYQIQEYFNDWMENGREVVIGIEVFDSWGDDLGSYDYCDDELTICIEDWIYENTVNGKFSTLTSTENRLEFDQVRIPLYTIDRNGRERAIDTKRWASGLRKFLVQSGVEPVRIENRGLGRVTLLIGE